MLLSHKKAPWRSYTKNYSYYRCESLTHTHIVLRINHIISAVDGKTASCITTNPYTHLLTIAVHSKHQARCCRHISYQCESKNSTFSELSLCRPALLTGILKWSQDTNHAGSFHSRHTQSYLDYLGWNWPWVLAAELLRGTNAPFHKYWYQECQKVKGQCSGPHNTQVINLIKITKLWQYSFAQMNRDLDEKLKHPFFFEQQIVFILF